MPDNPIILDIQGDASPIVLNAEPYSKGDPGKSAYQSAVDCGFEGTEEEWLASLVGPEGPPGTTDWDGITNKPSINGVTLGGSQTSADLGIVTTPDWNEDDSTASDYILNRPNIRVGTDEDGSSVVMGVLDENTASGKYSIAAGRGNQATSGGAVSFGRNNKSTASLSLSSGYGNTASAQSTFATGDNCTASATTAFACGYHTTASGQCSHSEGYYTQASGGVSHAEGRSTVASANNAHAEGESTLASGVVSHAEGYQTIANHAVQHVFGRYNIADPSANASTTYGDYVEIVGNGADAQNRSNARTLDWSGNEVLAGKLTVGAGPTANMDVATKQYVDDIVGNIEALLAAI